MEFNQIFDYRIFDSLIDKNIRFALYRLPGQQDINLVLQHSSTPIKLNNLRDLSDESGFIIAPFHTTEDTPIIIIRPDIVSKGETAIFKYLNEYHPENITTTDIDIFNQSKIDTFARYKTSYDIFQMELKAERLQKLVLSRTSDYPISSELSGGNTFIEACKQYPFNYIFLCHTPETGTWLGISPELLLSEENKECKTVALAGTKDLETKEWDDKNRKEQDIVVEYMRQQLRSAGYTFDETEPFTVKSGIINHLKTEFSFRIKEQHELGHLLDLLHPSPAVCGFPKEEAFSFIQENEGYDRRYYSGFIGELNMAGRSNLYVNLRCMQIGKKALRLYAGGGLLPSSEIESEWNETENKLQTIRTVIEQ